MKKHSTLFYKNKRLLLLLLGVILTGLSLQAQVLITVGTGSNTQGTTGATPYGTYYEDGKVQYLITKTELNALSANTPGQFTSLAFNVSAVGTPALSGFTIKLGHTAQTSLSGYATLVGAFTTCYTTGTSVSPSTGWNTYTFTTPFNWDNVNNIVVEVCFDNAAWGGNGTVYSTTTAVNTVYGTYQDGATGCASGSLSNVTSANTNRPNMRLGFLPASTSPNDIGVLSIDSPTIFCTNTQNVYATVRNFGTNIVGYYYVNWSVNGITQTPVYSTNTLDTNGGSGSATSQINLGSYYFPNNVASNIKAWTSLPNGVADTVLRNDTAAATKSPAFPGGTYTIGGVSPDFATIDAAISAITANGICGPVYFTIAPGTYTRGVAINIGNISGASSTNTITFDGQNANTCKFTGNLTTGILNFNNAKYITFRNMTIENTYTGTTSAISISGTSRKVSLINITARMPKLTGTSSTGYCINVSGTVGGTGISNGQSDSITVDSCRTVGAGYGVVFYGNQNALANSGMVLSNTVIDSCNYMGAYIYYNYNPVVVKYNTINMQGWNYGFYGLYFYYNQSAHTTISHELIGNRINNFGYYGMYCYYPVSSGSAAPVKIFNNVLVSYNTGSYSGYYGIYLYNGYANTPDNVKVYHNTIIMRGTQSSTTASCFYYFGASYISIKNNVFAVYSGGYTPLYLSTSPIGNTVNYNNYYNATGQTANLLYRGSFYNSTSYKSSTAGGDSSVNTLPSFVNINALPFPNLNMSNGCDGQGVDLSADVPTDIANVTRSLTNPTIGAYEFVGGSSNNLAIQTLITPVAPIVTGTQDLIYTVKNIGSNTVYSYNASYKLNSNTAVTLPITTTLATCEIDTVVFTSSNQITLGPNNNITWYTDGTNGFGDSDPSNDTMRVTYNAPLTGTFTVGGTNPDYATPALAAAALANGVGGPVVFDIRPGTYTGQVVVNGPIAGTSAVNTITFKGQNKTTTIISGNTSTALFLINNASHVVVRDLTITNINTSTPVGIAVVGSSGSYNGKGTQLINCNVNVPIILSGTSSVGYGIIFTGTAGGYGLTAMGADSVLVDSCTITGGGYGLVFYGSSNSNYNRGNVFSNNLIDKCNYQGGYIAYQYNPVVVKYNTFNIQGQNYGFYGLYFYFNQSGNTSISHEIIGNRINNFGYYGLYCYYPTSTGSAAPVKIYNNVLISYNTGSYTGYYGIYLYNGNANSPDNVKVFHNTIIMRGTQTSNTATCFYYFGASYITIKNNIFAVYSGGYTPLYLSTNPVGNTVNYNNYYNATGQTANLLYRGSFFNSSTYQTATSGGDSSFNVSPSFVNINATPYPNVSMANGCDGKALDLTSEVPNDIVHATRSAANSTVGAYEFAGSALNSLAVQPLLTPVSPITTGTQDLIYTVKNTGSNLVYNYNASYKLNANTPVTMAISNTLAPCESDTIVFTSTNQVTLGLTNNLKWYTDSPNNTSDANAADDTMSVVLVAPLAAGTYTVGGVSPDFATVSAAVAALANGIGGPVVFDIRPGTYFGQYSLNGVIAGASNVNTITFKGSGASTCRLTGNYATAIFTLNGTKYVTIRDITIENTNTGTTSAISICGASRKILLNNVTARMPILTGTSSTGYCINVSGTVGGNGITTGMSDSITVDSCRTVGAGTGVTFYGSSSNSANAGMVLSNTVIDSCNYMGAYIYYNYNPVVVRNNTINMQGWNYGYYGIYFFFNQSAHTTISHEIIGNRINNFGYYGIYLYFPISTGSAAPVKIFNNVVVSQNTGSYTGFYGIYLYNGYANSADNLKVYHNTIIMRGTQTSNSATCLYYSGASYLTAKNNIFAVYSGGYTPLYLGTNPVGNTINYNNYYNATGLTSYLVYRGSYYTSANYKVATAGGDSSFNLAPSFINLAATPYANLELDNGCDGYGVDLTTEVPTDIEGTTRNASTITPGAYEFTNYVANNLAVKGLASPAPPISFGSRDVKYAVRNVGTNSVTSFMANYKLNNNTPISQYISSTIAPCAVDTVLFTGANQVTLGVINNLTWYTDSPNGLTDGDKNNDTLRTEFYNQLAGGTYTVGGVNPDFATPAAAVAALASGIGGAVVFDIRPGTYTGQLVINGPITGLNATNTITFKGQNKATTIITGSSTSAMFLLNQVSYITIRDLTVTNTSTSTPVGIGVIGNSSSNVGVGTKIINCNVNVPIIVSGTSSTGYGISFTATASGHGASTTRMDSILVDSCTITGGGYGLVAYGASNSSYNRNLIFRNNTINNCNYQGAYIAYNYNAVVFDNNTIHMQGFNYGYYGLYFYYNQNSDANNEHIITRNRIDGFGGYGVYLYYTNGSALAKPTLFANNIVIGNSPSSSYPGVYGVYLYNPSTYLANAYHNTIVMSGAGSAPSYACFLNAGSSITNIKNNIFWVTNGSYTPFYTSTSLSGNSLNYNLYYNATNTSTGNLVYRDAVYYTPLNYLSATAGGDSSFNLLPPLDNAYKLTNGCQRGVTTNGLVNQDIEGNSRLLAEPNLGAYEYQGVSLDLQVSSMPYPATPITLGAQDLSVIVRNNGTSTITSFNIAYTLNNGTPVVMPWSGSLPACDVDTIIFTGTNQITLGNSANAIKVYTYSPNSSVDLNLANDTLLTVLSPPLNGTYVIGNAPSDFVNFSAATSALQIRGVSGPVVFNVKTGVYNEQVLVGSTIGTSPTNTVTFKSLANHVDSVEINNTGNFVVKLNNGANYIVFDKLTISQTNPTVQGAAIFVSSMCNYDTIRNCKVNAAIYNVNGVTATHYLLQANPYIGTGLALINNRFNGGYYGPYVFGTSRTTPHRFTYIVNNTFDNIYFYQMYQYYSVGLKFMNNTFTPQTVGGTTTNYAYCYYADSGFQFVNNNWNGNNYTSVYFYMYYSSSKFNERSLIANNRIFAAPNAYFYVGQTGTEYQDIVHNTFFTGTGYFYVGANVTGNFRIMNNVFSGSGSYAYYFSTTPNASLMQSDYNLVHSTGSSTPYYLSSARTLTEFRSLYPGFERNSLSYTASFTSVSNPAPLASDPSVWAINGRGTHLNVASADANNVTRPATPAQGVPDLGAFEVTPTSTPPLAVASPAAPVQGGTQLFTFGEDTVATIQYDLYQPVPTSVNVRQYTGVRHPQVSISQNYTNVYNQTTASGSGTFQFTYNMYFKDPQIGTNPSKSDMISAAYRNSAWTTYGSGASTIDSIRNRISTPLMSEFGDYIGTDKNTPLPIALTSFDAKANGKNVLVTWATASEKNASHFELQISVDGKNFKPIAKVKATGNSNTTKEYNYNHFDAFAIANTLYYRLKSVDVDGESAISKVAIVTLNKATIEDVVVYPNPFTSELTIALPNNEQAQVEIVSLEGVQVLSSKVTADANGMVKMEGLNNLSAGVYFVRITQNGQTTVSKLVKQ